MTTISKFNFDNVFDVDENGRVRKTEENQPQFTEDDLNAARAEGWRLGFEAGHRKAHGELQAAVAATTQAIANELQQIDARHQQALLRIDGEAADLAMMIASKLAPELISREPLAEITALITRCLAEMPNEPRLVVRVAEDLVDDVSGLIDELVVRSGFTGKIALLGEPGLHQADCRIEWADGGAERDIDALNRRIDEAVGRYRASVEDDIERLLQVEEPAVVEAPDVPAGDTAELPAPAPLTFDDASLPEPMEAQLPPLAHRPPANRHDADQTPVDPDTASES